MKAIIMNLLNRFKEPSSLAGVAVLLGMFGVPNAPELVQGVGQVVAGGLAVAAIFVKEKGNG
jgi:hypothetical protein